MYDAIRRLIDDFKACNLRPPNCIILETHQEGMRFMQALGVEKVTATIGGTCTIVIGPGDRQFVRIVLYGIQILWPS